MSYAMVFIIITANWAYFRWVQVLRVRISQMVFSDTFMATARHFMVVAPRAYVARIWFTSASFKTLNPWRSPRGTRDGSTFFRVLKYGRFESIIGS